ncbi:hypothetical protein AXX12_03390 [Anaerosporomusa subterranea]|uniref:Uncharacterized protein n=1 Tax=Anaerosporomusa subterranea TaxID=1794912 RepID=A0A154BTN7_ANASB|nr:hypothetical protein [Anaerosporomusa subterranea]KYZ77190.1 hypothetical protein AXX12_03390 [Anaerosporomusa subterranea]
MSKNTQANKSKDRLDFALQMEENNLSELLKQTQESSDALLPAMNVFLTFQQQFLQTLKDATLTEVDAIAFPSITSNIIPDEAEWQMVIATYAKTIQDPAQQFLRLWLVNSIFEKTAAFYRQVSISSASPAVRLFASSSAELKKIMARRVESVLRVCINKSWEKLGFCPFPLN